ncbi:SMC-Scp complex subunit ScpB [Stenotrophomonas panacihumi]|nr:SMC-Scp complex subunit ScpB [Stenotrophomonas panacihumi]
MDQPLITRIVEGALLASPQPLTLAQLQGLFPEEEPAPPGSIERAIELLREGCAERGVELVEVASGFRFQVKADVHGWVARLWTERKTKYTRATLETLALIAYRQPITRGEIEQVRGVAVSSNIIQALEEREWIRVVGHRDVPGKPALFGTTKGFLDYFGLKRLDELPPLSELKDIGELEPQLPLDSEGQPAAPLAAGAALDGEGEAANDADADADADAGDAEAAPAAEAEDEVTPTEAADAGAEDADAQDAAAEDDAAPVAADDEPAQDPTPSDDADADTAATADDNEDETTEADAQRAGRSE